MPTAKGFRFEPDTDGIFEVSSGEAVRGVLTQRARDAAAKVKTLGPQDPDSFFGYKKSVKAEPAKRDPSGRGYVAGVRVDTPGWHLPEFGTAEHPPTAPLRRGVRLAGLDFREGE